MKKPSHIIIGIHIQDRVRKAAPVQKLLTQYGCAIKTRLGLHEVHEGFCAGNGIVLLELAGDAKAANALAAALGKLPGVDVKKLVFSHD